MSSSITLPADFSLVGLGVTAALLLNQWQQHLVVRARKTAGVRYPTLYATDAEAAADPKKQMYNCTQRANANTLESIPFILAEYGFLSIFYPKAALAFLGLYLLGRVSYTINYAKGEPLKRNKGLAPVSYIGLAGLMFGSAGIAVVRSLAAFS
ncbi:hypothetical protein BCR39DRAFT_544780 [Naematelia encephala]|uniref:Membrane-associated proteins in eicosanoid and glutathione metabolism n=1 Tax=Naematelia encephala TaxID=71784 RepID=A0A1Y2ARQ3_9TREE|nr:hypothetical protein BCR39DRAFT_544780 [Naematelia encephala]